MSPRDRIADFASQKAQADRIVNALRRIGGYRASARWSRGEFMGKIAQQLAAEECDAAWTEYLSNEHGQHWFYDPSTDSWKQE